MSHSLRRVIFSRRLPSTFGVVILAAIFLVIGLTKPAFAGPNQMNCYNHTGYPYGAWTGSRDYQYAPGHYCVQGGLFTGGLRPAVPARPLKARP